jgi:DinB superfamily
MSQIQEISGHLQEIIASYSSRLESVSEDLYASKPRPEKWSRKEILGHLLDSAQNNIRRFVVGQYEEIPKIIYKQDLWVSISNYQDYPVKDMITLWVLLNKHICRILGNTSLEKAKRKCETNDGAVHSIEWLAMDYNRHLLHHLHQVLDLEPIGYP